MTESQRAFRLSVPEADVLVTIDHVGWHSYLWFPVVQREVMDFASENPDEEVHAAFASLIRKGALEAPLHSFRLLGYTLCGRSGGHRSA